MRLSDKQQKTVEVLKKYPSAIIMIDGYLTGGHGIKLDLRTVEALKKKGIIANGKLTEKGFLL